MFLWLLLVGICVSHMVDAQFSAARNFWPASYPLAVRSPYLNTWITGLAGTSNLVNWATHWDLANNNGWSGLVRVDGVAFVWLGNPPDFNATVLERSEVTPTRSIFTVTAGPVRLNITFLSPIEPTDLVKQSLPFSYLVVDVTCLDGKEHAVQLYSDISTEWITGNRSNIAVWNTMQTADSVYHRATRQVPEPMTETGNIAEDSIVYYAMKTSSRISFQSGQDIVVRGQFGSQGKLLGSQDANFRPVYDNSVVFGLSMDLGTISSTTSSVVWAIGLIRDPVIAFSTDFAGTQNRSYFFWTEFSTIGAAIDNFLADFPEALKRAVALDRQIMGAAQQVSDDYLDLVSLVTRQAIAGTDITISKSTSSGWNMSDVKAFMRDTGGSRRVNAVETLYAALPTYLYLNASWVGLLLDPLLQYQASSFYMSLFAAPDLGLSYPQAPGNSDTNGVQGLEDSGDMLVATWAHATFSGDGTLIGRYYNLLKTWADYVVAGTLKPSGQTVDGLSKPDMTNLAIKGIIAIQAMASISKAVGNSVDADHYSSTASSYASQWKAMASSSGYIASTYDASSSSALIYNLFADKLFKFGLVDDATYAAQTAFYASEFAGAAKFGLPFDSDTSIVKAHWTLFTAATVASTSARDAFVSMAHLKANDNVTAGAFPASYDIAKGAPTSNDASGQASPALGAAMSILAPTLQNQTITVPPLRIGSTNVPGSTKPAASEKKEKTAAIAGGVMAGIMVLLTVCTLLLLRRRRQRAYALDPDTVPIPFFNGMMSWSYPTESETHEMPEATEYCPSPVARKRTRLAEPEHSAATARVSSNAPARVSSGQLIPSGSETLELREQVHSLILEMSEHRELMTWHHHRLLRSEFISCS
ncbi:hypothetical protein C8J56DRAFT_828575 [Mycena floridula]|nr:hypothetical protein C8J56DRAFT_828575 [Mycena floridula]